MSDRLSRAEEHVNDIIDAVGPRAATSALQHLIVLRQAEKAVADCRDAASRGIEAGTFRFTAEIEEEKAQELADAIAREWDRVCGEDRDAE